MTRDKFYSYLSIVTIILAAIPLFMASTPRMYLLSIGSTLILILCKLSQIYEVLKQHKPTINEAIWTDELVDKYADAKFLHPKMTMALFKDKVEKRGIAAQTTTITNIFRIFGWEMLTI